jgi:putative nucleotidyltransferase with HDIG domain
MKSSVFPSSLRRWHPERWNQGALAAAFLVALAIVLAAVQLERVSVRPWNALPQTGDTAANDFIVARDFMYVDVKATEERRAARARLVPPVFSLRDESTEAALRTFDRFSRSLDRLLKEGAAGERIVATLERDFPQRFAPGDLSLLIRLRDLPRAIEEGRGLLRRALARGIMDIGPHREAAQRAGSIELRRVLVSGAQSFEVPIDLVITPQNVVPLMETAVTGNTRTNGARKAALLLLQAFAAENSFYNQGETTARMNQARASIEPVAEMLPRGLVLARRGDFISEPVAAKIRALNEHAREFSVGSLLGSAFFLLLVFALAAYLFSLPGSAVPLARSLILLLLGLGLAHVLISAAVARFFPLPDWLPVALTVPTSAMSMLVALLISTPAGVFFSLAATLPLVLVAGPGIPGFLFSFLSGIAATAVALRAERRIDLVRAGLVLALLDAAIATILGRLGGNATARLLVLTGIGIANGFLSSILVLGFLPIFEHALNAPTRFKLMELSDLNAPLFKRMLLQAPGTYTHSINVASLAESACEAIGANAMLARVSAYYHDIGKVDQADYFIENQKAFNRHDRMKPSLSVAVIKSHVRIGIEKARELRLPQAIIDIIAQHHGRGLITYFYHQAMTRGENPRVSRDDYSYPGARPKTKEAAVLMLADTVEAASRSLRKPTESRLAKFVQDIIMEKLSSGELGDSNLTFREIEAIRKSFLHILEGYFHTRIEYPRLSRSKRMLPSAGEALP